VVRGSRLGVRGYGLGVGLQVRGLWLGVRVWCLGFVRGAHPGAGPMHSSADDPSIDGSTNVTYRLRVEC